MSTPDLLYTADEDDLRAAVRRLLEAKSPWQTVLRRSESGAVYDTDLWRRLASEVGAAGLAVPEAAGGAGASWREAAVVAEEVGRAVAPMPFLTSACLAVALLLAADETELLTALASGEQTASVVVPLSTAPGSAFPESVRVEDELLTGAVTSVADATNAGLLLVPATDADGPAIYVVDPNATGVQLDPVVALDLTRPLANVQFDSALGRRLVTGTAASEALDRALTVGAALLASEQLGLAERCLEMTVEYLRTRYQFGRPIGSFQSLKHRLADLWTSISQARAVARYAAACVADNDPDTPVAVAVAQAHASAVAVRAAEECVQMHGGIGFTWEHPAHLYLKRAKSDMIALGTPDQHRTALGRLVDLPAA